MALVWRLKRTGFRAVLFQRPVRAMTMIMAQAVCDHATQIRVFATHRPHSSILKRRLSGCRMHGGIHGRLSWFHLLR